MSSATVGHEAARLDSARREPGRSSRRPAAFADPWLWAAAGFALCMVAGGLSGAGAPAPWVGCAAAIGMFATGIGTAIRLSSQESSGPFALRPAILLLLVGFQAITALLVTWALIAAYAGVDPMAPTRSLLFEPPPLRPGLATVIWLLIGPMTIVGAIRTWSHLGSGDELTPSLEKAAILMLAALASLASGFAMIPFAETMAFFLSILTAFLAAATSLMTLSINGRWLVLSAAIVTHFFMIINATLAAPPSSWLMGQLWTRMSRPYLEFMYLNNAYHFYAPDPGPASYLWFRVYFKDKSGEIVDAKWYKVPDIDPNTGNYPYRVALEYQRHLSVTENTVPGDTPPLFVPSPQGLVPSESFGLRIANSPGGQGKEVIGQPKIPFVMAVPFHPFLNNENQIHVPASSAKFLFETYVNFVAQQPFDVPKDYTVDSIRVYLVTHIIPSWQVFAAGMDPCDPEFYRPYYMGSYHLDTVKRPDGTIVKLPDGTEKKIWQLINDREPLLYWLLPVLRDNGAQPNSPIRNWCLLHAGDERYIAVAEFDRLSNTFKRRWVNEAQAKQMGVMQ